MFAGEKTNDGGALSPLRAAAITQQTFIINGNLALSHTIYIFFFSSKYIRTQRQRNKSFIPSPHSDVCVVCCLSLVSERLLLTLSCRNMNKWAK